MAYCGGLLSNYGTTAIYLLLKIINPDTRIGFSNLKDEIYKAILDKFGKNVKDILDYVSPNYTIIIDKGERHEYYVSHIFRFILSGINSSFDSFISITKDDWDTGTEIPAPDLVYNCTKKYNNMLAAK